MDSAWASLYRDIQITSQKQKWTSYHACRADTAKKVVLKMICLSDLNAKESDTMAWAYSQLESLSNTYVVKCSVTHYVPGDSLLLESPLEDGCNLAEHIKHNCVSCGTVGEEILWSVLLQMSMCLAYLHTPTGKGVILHRNLTPANVLVLADTSIKLCDIWLGPASSGSDNNETVSFQAPELQSLGSFSAKADIYSLGCIVVGFCMYGSQFKDKPTSSALESRGYTSIFAALILACLDLDPGKRPTAWDIVEQSAIVSEVRAIKFYAHTATNRIDDVQTPSTITHSDAKTSLMLAAEKGSLVGVQTLLYEAGAVWTGPRELPGTEIITATAASLSLLHGHKECFKVLIKLEVGLAGLTPLMLYATGIVDLPSERTALDALLSTHCGAQCMGVSALMIAAMYNNHSLFPLLRKEFLLLDSHGRSALVYLKDAEIETRKALLQIADEEGAQIHPISRQLILDGEIDAALIDDSDDLWALDCTGWCPLLYAASFNNLYALRYILSCEKQHPSNNILEAALSIARISRESDNILNELVAYLDKHTITVKTRRRYGDVTPIKTELMHAAARGDEAEVRKYIHQIGKNASGLDGGTALICAAVGGHVSCCQLLYRELGMLDKYGRTALDYAKEAGHSDCVYCLRHEYHLSKNEDQ